MQLTYFTPDARLKPFIECYWSLRLPAHMAAQPLYMPADGRVEMIFSFGSGSRRVALDQSDVCEVNNPAFVLGGRGQGYQIENFGALDYLAVRFKPGGLSAFAREPVEHVTDVYVGLEHLWQQGVVHDLQSQLYAQVTPVAQQKLLEEALIARFNPPDHLARLLHAVERLRTLTGDVRPIAEEVNLSQKHFERLFARYVGFRPTMFARIARFQRVMYQAVHQRSTSLARLAQDGGYYDQSHFNREFKVFTGQTPGEFLALDHAFVKLTTPLP